MPTRFPQVEDRHIVVIKIGGSVLTDTAAYQRCAQALHNQARTNPAERLLVVVSAEYGTTDRLLAEAFELCPQPDQRTLDLLWSTGELRSVARLTLSLQHVGTSAVGFNVHECGLFAAQAQPDFASVQFDAWRLLNALRRYAVVVVPGFLARGPLDCMVTLGRGASDLTAVLLASGLSAVRCELVKDVPGYFDLDPHEHPEAHPVPRLTFSAALQMADEGCELLQRAALEAARDSGTPLLVRNLENSAGATRVVPDDTEQVVPSALAAG